MRMLGRILMLTVRGITFSLFAFGAVTMIAEWKRIAGPAWKKVLYIFTFPFFMLTYVPISIAALVGKVEWKPIQHGIAKVQEERERVMPPSGWCQAVFFAVSGIYHVNHTFPLLDSLAQTDDRFLPFADGIAGEHFHCRKANETCA